MQYVEDFFRALQFLTRLQIMDHLDWSAEASGRSVRFFPLVGACIGAALGAVAWAAGSWWSGGPPRAVLAIGLLVLETALTGGLHIDGLMDTADGLFSGRSREKMLEIMKDSRVGSFGVIAFTLLALTKYALYQEVPLAALPLACLVMPIAGRGAAIVPIVAYPYVRPEGLGRGFGQYAGKSGLFVGGLLTLLLLSALGAQALWGGAAALAAACVLADYAARRLGGLTGDVYGAIIEIGQTAALATFVATVRWPL